MQHELNLGSGAGLILITDPPWEQVQGGEPGQHAVFTYHGVLSRVFGVAPEESRTTFTMACGSPFDRAAVIFSHHARWEAAVAPAPTAPMLLDVLELAVRKFLVAVHQEMDVETALAGVPLSKQQRVVFHSAELWMHTHRR